MNLRSRVDATRRLIEHRIWQPEGPEMAAFSPRIQRWLRIGILAAHNFFADQCLLRAASLTLVFLFSLAPALAVGFSVAKGFGEQQKVRPMIERALRISSAADGTDDASNSMRHMLDGIFGYIDRANAGAMGVIGMALMLYAAYSLLAAIERAMNDIWRVRKRRTVVRRVVDYVAVLFIFPLLLVLTSLLTVALQKGPVHDAILRYIPSVAVSLLGGGLALIFALAAFWFLYYFFPNTRVKPRSALVGAVVAALLWQALQFGYMWFQVGVVNANAIYGAFAAVPVFILWLQFAWLAVLFGAEVSHAHASEKEWEYAGLRFTPSQRYREKLALGAMAISSRAFLAGQPAPDCEAIARRLGAPMRLTRQALDDLASARLLSQVTPTEGYQPARPLERITVGQVLRAVREMGQDSALTDEKLRQLGLARLADYAGQEEQALGTTMAEVAEKEKG